LAGAQVAYEILTSMIKKGLDKPAKVDETKTQAKDEL
jgi:hypothetical protein